MYCAAADREQARLVFNAAKTMVTAEPELASRSRIYTNSIVVEATNSVLKVVSAEAYSKHGINAHGIIIDELHAQPNRELVDVLTTSTGARRQPLIVYITTADYDRESICALCEHFNGVCTLVFPQVRGCRSLTRYRPGWLAFAVDAGNVCPLGRWAADQE